MKALPDPSFQSILLWGVCIEGTPVNMCSRTCMKRVRIQSFSFHNWNGEILLMTEMHHSCPNKVSRRAHGTDKNLLLWISVRLHFYRLFKSNLFDVMGKQQFSSNPSRLFCCFCWLLLLFWAVYCETESYQNKRPGWCTTCQPRRTTFTNRWKRPF